MTDIDDKTRQITTTEAAELYGLSRRYLTELARKGRLKAKRIGRSWVTTPADVEVVLAANIDSAESSPRTLDAERLVEEIRARARQTAPATQATRRRSAELEQRQQLWHLVLAAVLGAMLLEAIYANRIALKRSSRKTV